jgi:hypothetical protein
MMNGGPFVLYALSQLRQQEIERKARTAWWHGTTPQPPARDRRRARAVALDTVADGC